MALITNIIGAWKFNEASGNASDSSGNSSILTNNGTTTFTAGKFSNCADFGSTNTTKYFSSATALIDTSTAGASTVAGWVNINTAPASGISYELFSGIKNGGRQFEFKYENIGGTIQVSLTVFDGTAAGTYAQTQTLTPGTWYFIAWTVNANTISTYVNGSQVGSNQTITNLLNGSTVNGFSIGRHVNASAGYSCSKADESYAWTRVLSGAELSELYNSGNGLLYPFTTNSNFFPFF